MASEQQNQSKPATQEETEEVVLPKTDGQDFDIDDLLDTIDDVLEENAEEFVKGYIQKGGQ